MLCGMLVLVNRYESRGATPALGAGSAEFNSLVSDEGEGRRFDSVPCKS